MKQPKLKLLRYVCVTPKHLTADLIPTQGLLFIDNQFFCHTLEPSWKSNDLNSCIPDGKYKLVHYQSNKFGKCLILSNVKRRTGILIHKGNVSSDTTGCILVGSHTGFIRGYHAVLGSSIIFMLLMNRLKGFNGMKIEIKTISKEWGGYRP